MQESKPTLTTGLEQPLENKYFTPSIEDIKFGYEHEWLDSRTDWKTVKVECPDDVMTAFDDLPQGRIRVPYLTKEQIEKEGWMFYGDSAFNDKIRFKRKGYLLNYDYKEYRLEILSDYIPEENCFFDGQCKDINTFRHICKLLGIYNGTP